MSRFTSLFAAATASLIVTSAAQAALIAPVSATASTTWADPNLTVNNLINGNGMTNPGAVTATDTHGNGAPTGGASNTFWHSLGHDAGNPGASNLTIDFDLGAIHDLNAIVVWNFNAVPFGNLTELNRSVQTFNLIASTNSTFGDGDDILFSNLGLDKAGGSGAEPSQTVALPNADGVRHVRLELLTNYGDAFTGLSEVRFDVAAIPEPASLALLAVGGLLIARRRRAAGH